MNEIFDSVQYYTTHEIKHMADYISYILISIGILIIFSAMVGIFKFNDFFIKVHILGMIDSLGIPLILLGFMIMHGTLLYKLKIFLVIVILWILSPTSSHLLVKLASKNNNL